MENLDLSKDTQIADDCGDYIVRIHHLYPHIQKKIFDNQDDADKWKKLQSGFPEPIDWLEELKDKAEKCDGTCQPYSMRPTYQVLEAQVKALTEQLRIYGDKK